MTTLRDLLAAAQPAELYVPGGKTVVPADPELRDVTHDSRQAGPGVLFACRRGEHADGHDFAPDAVRAGSPALLVERRLDVAAPQLVVAAVPRVLGRVAAALHGRPSEALVLCGVTGTNGKTTTAYLLEAGLRACGHRTGLIGTVESRIAEERVPGVRTTPESTDLQRLFARMLRAGVSAAAMEVSSHGLALDRVTGTRFAAAAFTNLTQDHLDFHAGMEDYFGAKLRLFTPEFTPVGVTNIDDPWGRRVAEEAAVPMVRASSAGRADADVVAAGIEMTPAGSRFTAHLRSATVAVRTQLVGDFNVANVLIALATLEAAGLDPALAAEGIAAVGGVPGRMERVAVELPFTVLVDYAHTPDSLERVLQTARTLTDRRVLVVVGCGGDRDRLKRPLMGEVAAGLADLAVLTSDNPRSEDPREILEMVVAGARRVAEARYEVEADRREAIAVALRAARAGDVVVIAGKGHEDYQEVAGRRLPFDDREVVRDLAHAAGSTRA